MKTNEWAGVGNHTTALYWEYDTRTGRRANIDPKFKKFPGLSPYSTNGDNPIENKDPKGDELIAGGIGFLVGAAISIGTSIHDKGLAGAFSKENRGKTFGHALTAGISGGVIGLTNGASLLVTSTLVGAGQSMVDDLIDNKGDISKISIKKVVLNSVLTAGTAGFGRYLGGTLAGSGNGALGKAVGDVLDNTAGSFGSLVSWGVGKALDSSNDSPLEVTLPEITIHGKKKDYGY